MTVQIHQPTFSMIDNFSRSDKKPIGLVFDIAHISKIYLPALVEICNALIVPRMQSDIGKVDNRIIAYHAYKEILVDIFSLYEPDENHWRFNIENSVIHLDLAGLGDMFGVHLTCTNHNHLVLSIRAIEFAMLTPIRDVIADRVAHYAKSIECIVGANFNSTTLILKVFPL